MEYLYITHIGKKTLEVFGLYGAYRFNWGYSSIDEEVREAQLSTMLEF